jgi:hypothetical protein
MNINNFLTKENVNTLWDVISDEEIFKFLSRDIQSNVGNLFSTNIKGFFETEKTKTNNLIELNKKYILLILNYIKKNHPHQPSKIKILEEQPAKELITYEELQNDRKSHFEKDLQQRQQEFEDTMSIKAPPVPEFADKFTDKPIGEMDKIIKEMTSKRNYEVEQFNRNYQTDINQVNNWLKPQDTSVKSEKFVPQNKQEQSQQSERFRFLNNEEPENKKIVYPTKNVSPTKNGSPTKNVSWGENTDVLPLENNDEMDDIFKKLKKVNKKPEPEQEENNINLTFSENSDTQRISNLEHEMKNLHSKMDSILELLRGK